MIPAFGKALVAASSLVILSASLAFPVSAQQVLRMLPRPAPVRSFVPLEAKIIPAFELAAHNRTQFGKLEWIGGLALSSPDKNFGGLSGFSWVSADRFIAISDRGFSFSGRLLLEDGRPVGIDQALLQRLPDLKVKDPKWKHDAEGLAISGQSALVSFEGWSRVNRYNVRNGQLVPTYKRLKLPQSVSQKNKGNKGLEAVAIAPKASSFAGSAVLFSELAVKKRIWGWIHSGKNTRAFSIPQVDGMSVTEAAFMQNGDLIVLERSFSLLGGLSIQLRRILGKDLRAGDINETDVLFRGNLRYRLDNMEGLAVQPLPDGSHIITMVSDDNFNRFQNTLLLQFRLPAGR